MCIYECIHLAMLQDAKLQIGMQRANIYAAHKITRQIAKTH